MITYAASLGSFIRYFDETIYNAFARCNLRKVEVQLWGEGPDCEENNQALKLLNRAVEDKVIIPVSAHLPFYGGGLRWDPSALEEDIRKDVVARMSKLMLDNAALLGGNITLHASNEPPLAEHPQRIIQCRKSLEELLPVAEKLDLSINVEYLPRTCVGNCVEELEALVDGFPEKHVGIIMDVNHIMDRYQSLPQIIERLAPRLKAFHICDYDGVDEMHWFPWQGIIQWDKVMAAIRKLPQDVLLISETMFQLGTKVSHVADPYFGLRQTEKAFWFLENCDELMKSEDEFRKKL